MRNFFIVYKFLLIAINYSGTMADKIYAIDCEQQQKKLQKSASLPVPMTVVYQLEAQKLQNETNNGLPWLTEINAHRRRVSNGRWQQLKRWHFDRSQHFTFFDDSCRRFWFLILLEIGSNIYKFLKYDFMHQILLSFCHLHRDTRLSGLSGRMIGETTRNILPCYCYPTNYQYILISYLCSLYIFFE
jgi:hypothetical protein